MNIITFDGYLNSEEDTKKSSVDGIQNDLAKEWDSFNEGEEKGFAMLKIDISKYSKLKKEISEVPFEKMYQSFWAAVLYTLYEKKGLIWSWMGDGGLIVKIGNTSDIDEERDCRAILEIADAIKEKFAGELKKIKEKDLKENEITLADVKLRIALHYARFKVPGKNNLGQVLDENINLISHLEEYTYDDSISATHTVWEELTQISRKRFRQCEDIFEGTIVYTTNHKRDDKDKGELKLKCDIDANCNLARIQAPWKKTKIGSNSIEKDFNDSLNDLLARWMEKLHETPQGKNHKLTNVVWNAVFNGYMNEEISEPSYPAELISGVSLYPHITASICNKVCDFLEKDDESLEVTILSTLLPTHYFNFPHSLHHRNSPFCYKEDFVDEYYKEIKKLIKNRKDKLKIRRYTLVLENNVDLLTEELNGYPIFSEEQFMKAKTLKKNKVIYLADLVKSRRDFKISTQMTVKEYKSFERTFKRNPEAFRFSITENAQKSILSDFINDLHSENEAYLYKLGKGEQLLFKVIPPDYFLFTLKTGTQEAKPFLALFADIDRKYRTVQLRIHVGNKSDNNIKECSKIVDKFSAQTPENRDKCVPLASLIRE